MVVPSRQRVESRSTLICHFLLGLAVAACCMFAQAQTSLLVASKNPPSLDLSPTAWAAQNRFLEVSIGQSRQDYREVDTQGLTGNSILNTESGYQSHAGITLRWQTDSAWLVQLQTLRQNGTTNYDGYLQAANGSITPYQAHTGNIATQTNVQFGYALNSGNWPILPPKWQIAPLLRFGRHHWERNLVQYSETYDYDVHSFGAQVQWQAREGTVLEMQAVVGFTQTAYVSAPDLVFATSQPGGNLHEWQLGIRQDLATLTDNASYAGWHIAVRYTASKFGHGASSIAKGLQAPPNFNNPSSWLLGLQKHF